MIELALNYPIDYEVLKILYARKEDLQMAWPGAKFPLCEDEWNQFLSSPEIATSLLFRQENVFVGHLVLKLRAENQLYICFVILDKAHRGQGIIYQMMKLTEEYAFKNFGCDRLWLHVDPENYPALKTYEKVGYVLDSITEAGRYRMFKTLTY